jgi:hypothetical protein
LFKQKKSKMKTFKKLLRELRACGDARQWAGDMTVEEAVEKCHRGDWLIWLAAKVNIGLQPLTLAKAHCANTIRHLMQDERSIKAIDVAVAFGEGNATIKELSDAAAAAAAAAASYAAYYAEKENQLQTADICRKYIGQLIIDKVNELLK